MARRFIFEHKKEPVLPPHRFLKRMLNCILISMGILAAVTALGAAGYHAFEGQAWLDAFLNSVMVINGLGLEGGIKTSGGKLFTIGFSLLGAFSFYISLGIIFSPILHRFLHHFHLDIDKD